MIRLLAVIALAAMLAGCATALVTGTAPQGNPELSARVERQLAGDGRLGGIVAESRAGVVTLYGRVPDRAAESKAVGLARSVAGVSRVVSRLRVAE